MIVKTVPERADLLGRLTAARFDSATGEGVTNTYDGFGRLNPEDGASLCVRFNLSLSGARIKGLARS